VDGVADFNGLHSRRNDDEVMFYAFNCLVSGKREADTLASEFE
jgi:hypothetical protein